MWESFDADEQEQKDAYFAGLEEAAKTLVQPDLQVWIRGMTQRHGPKVICYGEQVSWALALWALLESLVPGENLGTESHLKRVLGHIGKDADGNGIQVPGWEAHLPDGLVYV